MPYIEWVGERFLQIINFLRTHDILPGISYLSWFIGTAILSTLVATFVRVTNAVQSREIGRFLSKKQGDKIQKGYSNPKQVFNKDGSVPLYKRGD